MKGKKSLSAEPCVLTSEDLFKALRMWEFTPEQATACRHTVHPLPVHAPVTLAAITFTLQPHPRPILLTPITLISPEIPPKIKASPHLPRQMVNSPRSLWALSSAAPICCCSSLYPHSHSSHPGSPQLTSAPLPAKASGTGSHQTIWRSRQPPQPLCSHPPPKCGVKTPTGPTVASSTLLALQVLALNKTMRTSHPKE